MKTKSKKGLFSWISSMLMSRKRRYEIFDEEWRKIKYEEERLRAIEMKFFRLWSPTQDYDELIDIMSKKKKELKKRKDDLLKKMVRYNCT